MIEKKQAPIVANRSLNSTDITNSTNITACVYNPGDEDYYNAPSLNQTNKANFIYPEFGKAYPILSPASPNSAPVPATVSVAGRVNLRTEKKA